MPSEAVMAKARALLSADRTVADDELNARYLGQYGTFAELVCALFQIDSPHIPVTTWPYTHIDWEQAAAELYGGDGKHLFVDVSGHWFDALTAQPKVA